MTEQKPSPSNKQHLERLLTEWSKSEGITVARLRHLIGISVIAQMLDGLPDDNGRHRIVFKGGSALIMRFGMNARATKDLDAAFRGELDEAVRLIQGKAITGWHGFTGRVTDAQPIQKARTSPPPLRFKIKLSYLEKDFMTVPFEISSEEAASLRYPEVISLAISLEPVKLKEPDAVAFLPLKFQIAQKLHACTEASSEDHANDRARDLADLMLIEELGVSTIELPEIKSACIEIFATRATQPWPPVIRKFPGWNAIWGNLQQTEGLSISLEEAIDTVNSFVSRINTAE